MHILIESLHGFEVALRNGSGGDSIWYTSSPTVIEKLQSEGYRVFWLDKLLKPGSNDRIGLLSYDVVRQLTPFINDAGQKTGLFDTIQFVGMPLQMILSTLIYKQQVFDLWLKETSSSRLVVGDPALSPIKGGNLEIDRFDTVFSVLARKYDGRSLDILAMQLGDRSSLYKEIDKMHPMDRILSLSDLSISQITYRLLRYIFRGKTFQRRKRSTLVRILSDNELIREMLAPLILRGGRVKFEEPIRPQNRDDSPIEGLPDENMINKIIYKAAKKQGLDGEFGIVGSIVAKRLAEASSYWRPYHRSAKKRVKSWRLEDRPQVLVSNTISGISQTSLASYARKKGIPVVVVEHGVSAGLTFFHCPMRPFSEVSKSDIYLACSPNTLRFNDEEASLKGKSVAVGLASQIRKIQKLSPQRFVTRKRLRAKRKERVVIYLSMPYGNNVKFLPYFPDDPSIYAIERVMVKEVMPQVMGVPVIKLYNTRRMWDEHPFFGDFKACAPVRTLQTGDFRFLRAGVDLIILQSPLSTLGWALGASCPIFYLEQRGMKLLPHVEAALSKSVFMFSTEEPNWNRNLIESLNRTDEEIAEAWKAKREERERFLRHFVNGPERPGHNGARVLIETANRFYQKRTESN